MNQLTNNLIQNISTISTTLNSIAPVNSSETTQIITYALIATATVIIMVYHYIKNQEHASN